MDIAALLGIDPDDHLDRHADYLVTADEALIRQLVTLRHLRKLSQERVGELMGIDRSGVSKIESGTRDVQLSTLRRYAMAVGAVVDHTVHPIEMVLNDRAPANFVLTSSLVDRAPKRDSAAPNPERSTVYV